MSSSPVSFLPCPSGGLIAALGLQLLFHLCTLCMITQKRTQVCAHTHRHTHANTSIPETSWCEGGEWVDHTDIFSAGGPGQVPVCVWQLWLFYLVKEAIFERHLKTVWPGCRVNIVLRFKAKIHHCFLWWQCCQHGVGALPPGLGIPCFSPSKSSTLRPSQGQGARALRLLFRIFTALLALRWHGHNILLMVYHISSPSSCHKCTCPTF